MNELKNSCKFALLALGLAGCQTHAAAQIQATPAQVDVQRQAQACDVAPVRTALASGMTGAQLDAADVDGLTPLLLAARAGCLPVVVALVTAGADIERVDGSGWSALHHASSQRHADVVDYLLAHGAEQERKTTNGETPLALALLGSRTQFGPKGDGHTTEMVLLSGRARAKLNPMPAVHTPSASHRKKKSGVKKAAAAKSVTKQSTAKPPAAKAPAAKPSSAKNPASKPTP